MLTIQNKDRIVGDKIVSKKLGEYYYVYGIYEDWESYQIHIKHSDGKNHDTLLILQRNKTQSIDKAGIPYQYYKLYNDYKPQNWVGVTHTSLHSTDSMIKAIEYVINKI